MIKRKYKQQIHFWSFSLDREYFGPLAKLTWSPQALLTLQETSIIHYSIKIPKIEFIS